jgi:polyhydroxybutyrate depolymerase
VLLLISVNLASADSDNGTTRRYDIDSGGRTRSYLLHVPPGYNGKPVPLLVALHPALSTGSQFEGVTHFDTLADTHGFIVAYPDGISRRWNAGGCCGPPMQEHVDDIGFVEDMVAKITAQYAIDPARHFVTGFSNGAFLAHHIACLKPDDFAAYAAVAGSISTLNCLNSKPTPFLILHGMVDHEVDWHGGERWGFARPSLPDVLSRIAARNHCGASQSVVENAAPAVCRRYDNCGSNELTYCQLDGVGHQWPGSGKAVWSFLLGPNTDKFNASQHIWDFFERHPRS